MLNVALLLHNLRFSTACRLISGPGSDSVSTSSATTANCDCSSEMFCKLPCNACLDVAES